MVVRLTAACDLTGAKEVTSEQWGARRYYRARDATRFYVFPGGCVTQRFSAAGPSGPRMNDTAATELGLTTRAALQAALSQRSGGRLQLDSRGRIMSRPGVPRPPGPVR